MVTSSERQRLPTGNQNFPEKLPDLFQTKGFKQRKQFPEPSIWNFLNIFYVFYLKTLLCFFSQMPSTETLKRKISISSFSNFNFLKKFPQFFCVHKILKQKSFSEDFSPYRIAAAKKIPLEADHRSEYI